MIVDLHAPWNDELTWLSLWMAALLIVFGLVALFRAWVSATVWWPMPGRALMGWWLFSKGMIFVFLALMLGNPLGVDSQPSIKTAVLWFTGSCLLGSWVFARWYRWRLVEMPEVDDPRQEPML